MSSELFWTFSNSFNLFTKVVYSSNLIYRLPLFSFNSVYISVWQLSLVVYLLLIELSKARVLPNNFSLG